MFGVLMHERLAAPNARLWPFMPLLRDCKCPPFPPPPPCLRFCFGRASVVPCLGQVVILMAGLVFLSGGFKRGSVGYDLMTVSVALIVLLSTATFLSFVVFEVFRSIRFARLHRESRDAEVSTRAQGAGAGPPGASTLSLSFMEVPSCHARPPPPCSCTCSALYCIAGPLPLCTAPITTGDPCGGGDQAGAKGCAGGSPIRFPPCLHGRRAPCPRCKLRNSGIVGRTCKRLRWQRE